MTPISSCGKNACIATLGGKEMLKRANLVKNDLHSVCNPFSIVFRLLAVLAPVPHSSGVLHYSLNPLISRLLRGSKVYVIYVHRHNLT